MAKPCVIVDQAYCAPDRVKLIVIRKTEKLKDDAFVIADSEGDVLFQPMTGFSDGMMVLLDGSKSPVLTMKKRTSLHGRWQVYRGNSTENENLLYTVKRPRKFARVWEPDHTIDVFLSHNEEEKRRNFRIQGPLPTRHCVVYEGESDTIVAEMGTKEQLESGGHYFPLEIHPNIDSAFIASLVIFLDHLILKDRAYEERNAKLEKVNKVVEVLGHIMQ